MPSWVEARAKRIMKSTEDKYGPEKGKQIAFALATQQSHASGKSPKKWHGKPFGTPEGRREAKEKYDLPKAEYQKTAEEPALAWLEGNSFLQPFAEVARRFSPTAENPYPPPVPLEASLRALGNFPQMLRSPIPVIRGIATRNLMGMGDTYNRFKQLLPTMWTNPGRAMEMAGRGAQAGRHLQDVLNQQIEDASRPGDVQPYLHPIPSRETPDTRQVRLRESPETAMSQNRSSWWGNTRSGAGVSTPRVPNLSGRTAVAPEGYTPMEHTAMAGARQTKIGNLDQWNRETIEGRSLSHGTGEQPSPRPTRAQPIPVGMPGGGEAYFSPRQVGWLMSQGAFSGGGEPEKAKPSVWPRVGRAVLGGALGGIGAEVLARGVDIPPERRNLFRAGGIGLGLLASQLGEEKRAALVEGYLNRTLKHVHFLTKEAREELAKEASLGRLLAAARGVARSGGQVAKSLLPKAAPQVQQSARVLGHVPISRGPSGAIILPNAPTPPLVPSPGTLQRARASGVPAGDIWELLGKHKVRPLVPPAGYRGYDPTALARSLGRPPVYGSTALRPAVSLPTGELVPPWG